MTTPLISVLVCTYNGVRFIEEQVNSILKQTYPNMEIIISDDASKDGTVDIIKKFSTHPRVKINFNKQNTGLQKNIEIAANMSNGEFIAFSDQDDVWLSEKLEELYNAIGNHDLVYSDSILTDEKGNSLNKNLTDLRALQDIYDSKYFGLLNVVSGHTMLATKRLILHSLPVPKDAYYDWWIAVQASNLNGIKFLNKKLTLYRQHDSNLTENIIIKTPPKRSANKRYIQYQKDLAWLETLENNPLEKNKEFYSLFVQQFRTKEKGSFSWSLLFFLFNNQKIIFKFSSKGMISRLFDMRKISRGEKNK